MSTTKPSYELKADEFIAWLEQNAEDRGLMAHLRRALTSAGEHYAWPHLVRWCNLENDQQRTVYATVAACYALHPEHENTGNFGSVVRQIALGLHGGNDALQSFEGRFRRLLTCDSVEELCLHIRRVVQAAKQRGVPINYHRLLLDLLWWQHDARRVKVQWAQSYWGGEAAGTDSSDPGAAADDPYSQENQ